MNTAPIQMERGGLENGQGGIRTRGTGIPDTPV